MHQSRVLFSVGPWTADWRSASFVALEPQPGSRIPGLRSTPAKVCSTTPRPPYPPIGCGGGRHSMEPTQKPKSRIQPGLTVDSEKEVKEHRFPTSFSMSRPPARGVLCEEMIFWARFPQSFNGGKDVLLSCPSLLSSPLSPHHCVGRASGSLYLCHSPAIPLSCCTFWHRHLAHVPN